MAGRTDLVILPQEPAANRAIPWVWYAPTLPDLPGDAEKWMFKRFTEAGIAIAGLDVGESYGSPDGEALYTTLYETLITNCGFAAKPVLLETNSGEMYRRFLALSDHMQLIVPPGQGQVVDRLNASQVA